MFFQIPAPPSEGCSRRVTRTLRGKMRRVPMEARPPVSRQTRRQRVPLSKTSLHRETVRTVPVYPWCLVGPRVRRGR